MAIKNYDVLNRIGRDDGPRLPGDQLEMDEREAQFYVDNGILKLAKNQPEPPKRGESKTDTKQEG